MTYHQEQLLAEAKEYWEQGLPLPLTLFAEMAQEGLDVEALEAKHSINLD